MPMRDDSRSGRRTAPRSLFEVTRGRKFPDLSQGRFDAWENAATFFLQSQPRIFGLENQQPFTGLVSSTLTLSAICMLLISCHEPELPVEVGVPENGERETGQMSKQICTTAEIIRKPCEAVKWFDRRHYRAIVDPDRSRARCPGN